MNSLNQVVLEGNICFTPELKKTPNGLSVCTITIAVNRTYKNAEDKFVDEVSFIEVDAFGKLAENCCQYCPKGRLIQVIGRLKQDRWEDTEGNRRNRIRVMAEHIEFRTMPKNKENDAKHKAMIRETSMAAVDELNRGETPEDELVF